MCHTFYIKSYSYYQIKRETSLSQGPFERDASASLVNNGCRLDMIRKPQSISVNSLLLFGLYFEITSVVTGSVL